MYVVTELDLGRCVGKWIRARWGVKGLVVQCQRACGRILPGLAKPQDCGCGLAVEGSGFSE